MINRRSGILSVWILLLATISGYTAHAQSVGEDPIGFKGGYKALSRLCETNLDGAGHLLVNDYSRGYFISLDIPAGADTVANISFLTATPPEMGRQITWALKGTNGHWMVRTRDRKLLIPIFFCQNTPANDSMFSQLLVSNNVGFSIPGSPDQWPEAAEGVWIHPICPLVTGQAPRAPLTAAVSAPTTAASAPPSGAEASRAGTTATPSPAPVQQFAPATKSAPGSHAPTTISAVADSTANSGIYRTAADFDAGMMVYASSLPLEEKGLISWSPIDYASYAAVRVRASATSKDYQEFSPGSIYGFRSANIRYMYLKSSKKYLSVVYTGSPIYLFMDDQKQNGYNGNVNLNGIFMYAKTLDGPLKELTRRHIDEEFGANPQMAADLQTLRKDLDKNSMSMTRGDFGVCEELARRCLSKYAK